MIALGAMIFPKNVVNLIPGRKILLFEAKIDHVKNLSAFHHLFHNCALGKAVQPVNQYFHPDISDKGLAEDAW